MSAPKYLVVGMNGGIGSALYARLKAQGAEVWGTTQRRHVLTDPQALYLNLLEPESWSFNQKFDVVFFCAGICRMALCEEDPETTYKVNVTATLDLARHFSNQGSLFVFLSTNQVFSGNEPFMQADAEYSPQNEYGKQKAKIESLLRENCQNLAIVRLTKVVEPNMPLIQNWLQTLRQQQPVKAFTDMMLAPVSLRQVVDVLIKIGDKKATGIFHVSGAEDISYFALANYLAGYLQVSPSLIHAANGVESGMRKSFLPKFTTLDCSSIIAAVGEVSPHYVEVLQECFEIV